MLQRKKYLNECFESIRDQSIGLENLQVIFVNDASTDDTLEALKEIEKAFSDSVEVINLETNHKQGGARNIGLQYATGEYVAFVDADDWLDLTMCEKIYNLAVEYDIDILQFPFMHVFSADNIVKDESLCYGFLDGTQPSIKKGLLLGNLFTFGSQNKLYRRSLLVSEKAAFLEGVVYEEPYFVYPLLFAANRFYNLEEGVYYYRQTEPSITVEYMRKKTKLYDHPYVQLELIRKLAVKNEYIEEYYYEIEFHFLHSYYIETLYFAGVGNLYLGLGFFEKMQKIVSEVFPTYKENPYLQLEELSRHKKVIASVERVFTQEELDAYCKEVVAIMRG